MDTNVSELYSKRTEYKNLRENVALAINILSKNNISDKLASTINTLNTCYLVNDQGCKSSSIKNVGESLNNELANLNLCLDSITSKIYNLDKEIEEKETVGTVGL